MNKIPWAAIFSLGLTVWFKARKERQKEAREKAAYQIPVVKRTIASIKKKLNGNP